MAARNFLPRCNAFFNRIPIELLRILNSNAKHLGKKFLAAIFCVIVYSDKESESNDTLLHVVEFSNVHNGDGSYGSSNAT